MLRTLPPRRQLSPGRRWRAPSHTRATIVRAAAGKGSFGTVCLFRWKKGATQMVRSFEIPLDIPLDRLRKSLPGCAVPPLLISALNTLHLVTRLSQINNVDEPRSGLVRLPPVASAPAPGPLRARGRLCCQHS